MMPDPSKATPAEQLAETALTSARQCAQAERTRPRDHHCHALIEQLADVIRGLSEFTRSSITKFCFKPGDTVLVTVIGGSEHEVRALSEQIASGFPDGVKVVLANDAMKIGYLTEDVVDSKNGRVFALRAINDKLRETGKLLRLTADGNELVRVDVLPADYYDREPAVEHKE